MKNTLDSLKNISRNVRKDLLTMTTAAESGHVAGPMGIADVMTYLFFEEMNFNKVPEYFDEGVQRNSLLDPSRDRFVLSAAHMVPVLYSVLIEKGYIDKSEINNLRSFGSKLQGHTAIDLTIGVETTGGSLGQGVGIALGFAKSAKIFNKNYRTYCVLGDGESNEGSVWEAAMFGSKYALDNLVFILDKNNIQLSNFTENIMPMDPVSDKWKSFGWNVIEIDGNNFDEIDNAFSNAKDTKGKPSIIIANTIPGKGVSFIENNYVWHGKVLNTEELKEAIIELDK
ncbi:MAG: transketolase [bacterium]